MFLQIDFFHKDMNVRIFLRNIIAKICIDVFASTILKQVVTFLVVEKIFLKICKAFMPLDAYHFRSQIYEDYIGYSLPQIQRYIKTLYTHVFAIFILCTVIFVSNQTTVLKLCCGCVVLLLGVVTVGE